MANFVEERNQESILEFSPREQGLIMASREILKQGQGMAIQVANKNLSENLSYKQWLENQGYFLTEITDLKDLPLMDKRFLSGKGIPELCPNYISKVYAYSESSGMTGEPVQIPRLIEADKGIYPAVERMWVDNWGIDKRPSLTVVGWALGTWIAGTLMDGISKDLSKNGYELGVVSPGSDVLKTADLIMIHSGNYEQTILQGYPPYVAEVINELERRNVDLKSLNLQLFVAGEPNSEDWRILMQNKLSDKGEGDLDRVVSLLGTAEGGIMGTESKLSILIRKIARENPEFSKKLFGSNEGIPMIFQFPPQAKWIEEVNEEVVFTGLTGFPSVRYNMHDRGGVISFEEMMKAAKEDGYDLLGMLDDLGYKDKQLAPFPFLYVYGRSDGGVSIDGGNIYTADMDSVLSNLEISNLGIREYMLDIFMDNNTGKMRLLIHLELEEGIDPEEIKKEELERITEIVCKTISATNPDYRKSLQDNPSSATPIIEIHECRDELFEINGHRLKRTREARRVKGN